MEMRIPTDKDCFKNFIMENWKTFGGSVNKGIQKDVMCSFQKRTEVKLKTEDPKAHYISDSNSSIPPWLLRHKQCRSVDVLWGQQIKLIQVAYNSELSENQWNDLFFFEIVPFYCFGASEASKIDCFKN